MNGYREASGSWAAGGIHGVLCLHQAGAPALFSLRCVIHGGDCELPTAWEGYGKIWETRNNWGFSSLGKKLDFLVISSHV